MNANLLIRQENETDYNCVFKLIENVFKNEEFSDSKEHFLVERLRKINAFVPELSIIAEKESKIAGHILLTKIKIKDNDKSYNSLALAPVSVLPEFQNQGIGRKLILKAREIAKRLGFRSVVLIGHEKYYPKFGYMTANKFGIKLPFDVPDENCMVIELVEGGLNNVKGTVEYPKEFF